MIHRIETYFTFERRVGVMMIFFATTLFLRPFASGLDILRPLYGISISPYIFAYWFLIDGLLLLILRQTGALLFSLIFLPVTLYAFLLWWALLNPPPIVGPLGQDYSGVLVGWIIIAQARRAIARWRLKKSVGEVQQP